MNVNEMESGWGGGGARPPPDYENTGLAGWRKNSNWPGMMGGHGREAINNSLVYTGRAATLRNAGHPGGDG